MKRSPEAGDGQDPVANDGAREAQRVERRDIDVERGEPLAARERRLTPPRATPRAARPLAEWDSKPRILVTNDDGIESRGLPRAQAVARAVGRGVRAGTRDQPVGRGPHQDVHAPPPRPPANPRRRVHRLLGRRLTYRRGQPGVPRVLRHQFRPRRIGHQLRREPGRRHHLLGHRQRGHGGGHLGRARRSRSRRSTTSIRISRSPRRSPTSPR